MKYETFCKLHRSRRVLRRYVAEVKSWHVNENWGMVQLIKPVQSQSVPHNMTPFIRGTDLNEVQSRRELPLLRIHKPEVFHEGLYPDIRIGMRVEVTPDSFSGEGNALEVTLPGLKKIAGKSFDRSRTSSCAPQSWYAQNLLCKPFRKKTPTLCEDVDV